MKKPHRIAIDAPTYKALLKAINSVSLDDGRQGQASDMAFIRDDRWLSDTAVIDWVVCHRGCWRINLVFAQARFPVKFIVRYITNYSHRRKAEVASQLFRRQAAKDQRGTISIEMSSYGIEDN